MDQALCATRSSKIHAFLNCLATAIEFARQIFEKEQVRLFTQEEVLQTHLGDQGIAEANIKRCADEVQSSVQDKEQKEMESNSPAGQIIANLIQFRKFWLVPLFLCTLAALFYVLFSSKTYTTRQSLVIRDDLVGTFYKPGRFDSLDSMKSAQETILEISRRPQVIREALKKIGPPAMTSEASWLGDLNMEKTQGQIQIAAPNGAEFGRTEAIVLSVSQSTRERSREFINLLLDEIEKSLRDLRVRQFDSMQQELNQATLIAKKAYEDAADKLKVIETNVGSDLITLISLNDSQAGTNMIQAELTGLKAEQRKAWADLRDVEKQHEILSDVAGSPEELLEVPQELLALQPTLAFLAKGLNDAILNRSKAKGRYQVSHPRIRATEREVEDIKARIQSKLARTIGSLSYQLELRQGKYEQISSLIDNKQRRLGELSSMRVDYETIKATATKKREIYGKSQASLAEIESLGAAAQKIDLISRIGEPQTELYADGPSKKIVVGAGMIAGLFFGFGLVMFVAPFDDSNRLPSTDSTSTGSNRQPAEPRTKKTNESSAPAVQTNKPPETPAPIPEPAAPPLTPFQSVKEPLQTAKLETVNDLQKESTTQFMANPSAPQIESVTKVEPVEPVEPVRQIQPINPPVAEQLDLTAEPAQTSSPVAPVANFGTALASSSLIDEAVSVDSDVETEIFNEVQSNFESSETETNADLLDSFFSAQKENDASTNPVGTDQSPDQGPDNVDLEDLNNDSPLTSGERNVDEEISDAEIDRIIAQESSLTESDLQRLRVGQTSPSHPPENLDQLEQSENQMQDQLNWPVESMTVTGDSSLSPETTGLPLDTSIPYSAETENVGHDSVTNSGDIQPENRPTATTVDLRMLKEQLSGKSQDSRPGTTLSEKLAHADAKEEAETVKKELDQSITDLANSIADVCKKSNDINQQDHQPGLPN